MRNLKRIKFLTSILVIAMMWQPAAYADSLRPPLDREFKVQGGLGMDASSQTTMLRPLARAEKDFDEPNLGIAGSPLDLFPCEEIAGLMGIEDWRGKFRVEIGAYTQDEIRLDLYVELEGKNQRLCGLSVKKEQTISRTFGSRDEAERIAGLPYTVANFLGCGSTSGYTGDTFGYTRTFTGLKPFALVYFRIDNNFRRKGLGTAVYKNLEKYLTRCGFDMVAVEISVHGDGVYDDEAFRKFWVTLGFKYGCQVDYANSVTGALDSYLFLKVITYESDRVNAIKTAKSLWKRYQENKKDKSISVQAIKGLVSIGDPAVEFLIQDQNDNAALQALAIIGSEKATDGLFNIYLKNRSETNPVVYIIQKYGGDRAASYFIRKLKSGPLDIAVLELLKFLRPAECVIPAIDGIKNPEISAEDRSRLFDIFINIIYDPKCQNALKGRPDLKDYLANMIKKHLAGDPKKWPPKIDRILFFIISDEDVPALLDIYDSGQYCKEAKNVILAALVRAPNDETIQRTVSAYIDACHEDRGNKDKSRGALTQILFDLAESGALRDYLKRHEAEAASFIGVIKENMEEYQAKLIAGKVPDAYYTDLFIEESRILGWVATSESISILAEKFLENIRRDDIPSFPFLRALMLPENRESVLEVLSNSPRLISDIETAMIDKMLRISEDRPDAQGDNIMIDFLSSFIRMAEERRPAVPRVGFLDFREGFIQRGRVADCMVSLREYVIAHPDAQLEELSRAANPYLEDITSPKARADIRIGMIEYIRRRQKVRKIMNAFGIYAGEATEKIIVNGHSFPVYSVGRGDPRKDEIVNKCFREQIGSAPRWAKLVFLPDCVHIIIDDDFYLKVIGRVKNKVIADSNKSSANPLSDRERERLLHESGIGFFGDFKGCMAGVSLSRIATFERSDTDIGFIPRAMMHEWQHSFYFAFGNTEIYYRHLQAVLRLGFLIGKISNPYKELSPQARRTLVSSLTTVILTHYQNEMISEIIELNWGDNKDISQWFYYFKNLYREYWRLDSVIQAKIGPDEQKEIENEAYWQAMRIIKKYNRVILDLIKVRAALYRAEGAISDEEANRKAHFWVANFLHTMHIKNFRSLRKYVEILQDSLQVLQQAKVVPAAPVMAGSASERTSVESNV